MARRDGSTTSPAASGEKSAALEALRQAVAPGIDERSAAAALEITLDSIKVKHGALLIYDTERQTLSLLAHRNLSADAQKAMRSIRRGVAGVWDMPLHSLLQRRVYMIERPRENPFVPVLIDGSDQNILSNLVFLPLYSGGSASGVLLLIGSGARAIREPDIVALREHAKVLGAALRLAEQQRKPATLAAQPSGPAFDRAALNARIAELEALVESLRKAPPAAAPGAEATRRLTELTRDRDRLQADLAAREIDLVNLKSEVNLLRERTAEESERARKLSLELAQTRDQLAGITDRERQFGEERTRIDRSRSELEARVQGLERRLAKSMEHARETQAERASLAMRAAEAEAEVAELRKTASGREAQVNELRNERERLANSLRAAAARAQESEENLARAREDGAEALTALQHRLDETERHLALVERERDQLRAGTEGHSSVVEEIEHETQAIRAELARETERRRAAEDTSASVIRDAAALRGELERMQTEQGSLETTIGELRNENERLAGELDRSRSGAGQVGEALRAAEKRAADLERHVGRLDDERKDLEAEIGRLQSESTSSRTREDQALVRLAAAEAQAQKLRTELHQARSESDLAREEARARARERDAATARADSLDQRLEALLAETETVRTERENELAGLREILAGRELELSALRSDYESVQAGNSRLQEALSAERTSAHTEAARREEVEREVVELRHGLETAQAHGSRLTEELEAHLRTEEELRARTSALELELEQQKDRLRDDSLERQQLTTRLKEMEEVLRGATPDLAGHAADLDALAMLRTTLERSESARRTAEEAVERLEAILRSEQQETAAARAQIESERQSARELSDQIEELSRRLQEAEATSEAALARAEELVAEHSAASETARSLATELGRRKAELEELSDRLHAREAELGESRASSEQSVERIRSLEEAARSAAAEIAALKRSGADLESERQKLAEQHEIQIREANARLARLEEQLAASQREGESLRENAQALEARYRESQEALQAAANRQSETERVFGEGRSQAEKLGAEIESLRQQIAALEHDLRTSRTETERWQGLHEKLQRSLEERDRDLVGLRGVIAAMRKGKPATEAPPAEAAPLASATARFERKAASPAAGKAPAAPAPVDTGPPAGRTVMIFDGEGPSLESLSALCRKAGYEPRQLENGAADSEPPQLIAVNLLSTAPSGFDAIRRSRSEAPLRNRPIVLYAAKPGSENGLVFTNLDCLVRPVEEAQFTRAITSLIGSGKRITIIGEELDSVLKFNGWATSTGCSVSSAGDLKQGSDLLDIVKPDLIVFDFSRLGGEGAGLIVKVRRSARLQGLPLLIVLPQETSPATALFLKRLATFAEETPLDLSQIEQRLSPPTAA